MATAAPAARRPERPERPAQTARSLAVQVLAVTPAAHDAATLTLALPGTRRSPGAYRAGQFITLTIPTADGSPLYRSYSLCGDDSADAPWQITVKRTPGGKVSNYLIDRITPGMVLQASQPQGNFTMTGRPHPAVPFVFVAGGSGITPIYAMLRALARLAPAERPQVTLHYAYHTPDDAIFGRELLALDPDRAWLTQHHYVATQGKRLRADVLIAASGAQATAAQWYICGPDTLRHQLETAANRAGVPPTHLHTEVFVSPGAYSAGRVTRGGRAASIRLADSGAVLRAQPGETLLETLERCGYRPDFSCRAGACATCRLRLLSGAVADGGENNALTPAERAQGYVLSCVAKPQGDITLATAGRQIATARATRVDAAVRSPVARRRLRLGVAAATMGVFLGMWGLTHSSTTVASTSSGASSSSSGSSGSSSSGTGSSSSTDNGTSSGSGSSGSIFSQPSAGDSNSSTGTS